MRVRFPLLLVGLALAVSLGSVVAAEPASDSMKQPSTSEVIVPSSVLSSLDVFNQEQTSTKLGHLSNLIINAHTGHTMYGILDTGTFGKAVIVPWQAFQLHTSATANKNQQWLSLNKTPSELAQAPMFNKKHWSDFTSAEWVQSIGKFYGVQTRVPAEVNATSGQLSITQMIFESSKLSGLKVYNRQDVSKKLGSLDNLLIDASNGQVLYGVLHTGMMGKYIPVPWYALLLEKKAGTNDFWLTLNQTTQSLKNAPSISSKTDTSQVVKSDWQRSVDKFFGVRTAARPIR